MTRKLAAAAISVALFLPGYAEQYRSIIVEMSNHRNVELELNASTCIDIDESGLTFGSADGNSTLTVPLHEMRNWTYSTEGPVSGIEETTGADIPVIHISDGYMTVSGTDSATLFDTKGIKAEYATSQNGSTRIATSSLPSGIYILHTGKHSFKISLTR